MHRYAELAYRGVSFALAALDLHRAELLKELQLHGQTLFVKQIQAVEVQKAIIAIGVFSLFESMLQDGLEVANGFKAAKGILRTSGNTALLNRFEIYYLAINALKHGEGDSYNKLVEKAGTLPFTIKLPGEDFFFEGDIDEITTLIKVDNQFVNDCANVIWEVSQAVGI